MQLLCRDVLDEAQILAALNALKPPTDTRRTKLSQIAEEAGLDQALAFSFSNLGWALGHVLGAGGGGALAERTADSVVYLVLGVVCAATLLWVTRVTRRSPAAA